MTEEGVHVLLYSCVCVA